MLIIKNRLRSIAVFCVFVCLSGCATSGTTMPRRTTVDIERGMPIPPLDAIASALGGLNKLLLWNPKFANHNVSSKTEAVLADFMNRYELYDVKVRINQFAPIDELKRLFTNNRVAWPYRILGIPTTLISSATGRLFAGLLSSDYYDPFSNTIHIFSDDPSIALHEAGHAKDFQKQSFRGTYAFLRTFPGVNLAQELVATHEAFDYLELHGTDEEKIRAPRVLYPAFATYAGSYLQGIPFGWVGALAGGHFYGWTRSRYKREELAARPKATASSSYSVDPKLVTLSPS